MQGWAGLRAIVGLKRAYRALDPAPRFEDAIYGTGVGCCRSSTARHDRTTIRAPSKTTKIKGTHHASLFALACSSLVTSAAARSEYRASAISSLADRWSWPPRR